MSSFIKFIIIPNTTEDSWNPKCRFESGQT